MTPVVIESPYAGDISRNLEYARECMRDSLERGEAPYASHLLYTQVLDDMVDEERQLGIQAGFKWKHLPSVTTVFYLDRGWSKGMRQAMSYCVSHRLPYELRSLR